MNADLFIISNVLLLAIGVGLCLYGGKLGKVIGILVIVCCISLFV